MDLENIGLVFIKIELYRPWFFKGTAIDSILTHFSPVSHFYTP